MSVKTLPFEPADYLKTPQAQLELLCDALESSDPIYISQAIATIAKARGMSLEDLGDQNDLRLSALMTMIRALGLKMTLAA